MLQAEFEAFEFGGPRETCVTHASRIIDEIERAAGETKIALEERATYAALHVAKQQLAAFRHRVRTCDLSLGEEVIVDLEEGLAAVVGVVMKLPAGADNKVEHPQPVACEC